MSMRPGNLSARLGVRVNSARCDSEREECIGLGFWARINARTNVDRSLSAPISAGMEGTNLKLGNRKAEATEAEDEASIVGGKEQLVTRMLLYGCDLGN